MTRLFKPRRTVQRSVAEHVMDHMREIQDAFPDGKLTLVVRCERLEKPLIFTNDAPDEAISAIREMTTPGGRTDQVQVVN